MKIPYHHCAETYGLFGSLERKESRGEEGSGEESKEKRKFCMPWPQPQTTTPQ